jgi:GAF domain-containing protein
MTDDATLNTLIRTARDLVRDALRPGLDLDAFLAEVVRQTGELVPFDVGWLLLREGERVRIRAADDAHRGDVGMSFPIADCISGLSMLRREPVHIPDLADTTADMRRVYKPSRSTAIPMRSELVVPLLIGDEAIGALNIERSTAPCVPAAADRGPAPAGGSRGARDRAGPLAAGSRGARRDQPAAGA